MSEIVPTPHPEFSGYLHSLNRYFDHQGQKIDRLVQIQTHGVVSPRRAQQLGVSYLVNEYKTVEENVRGIADYDNIIFLFPLWFGKNIPRHVPGDLTLVISSELPVLTPDEMRSKYGSWVQQLSWMEGGEVYTFGQIPSNFIVDIRGVKHD
jgi:hypothetical protein